jgi:hypothetical protein
MPDPTPSAERAPSGVARAPAAAHHGLLSRVVAILRGDKYMVDAYPPARSRDER